MTFTKTHLSIKLYILRLPSGECNLKEHPTPSLQYSCVQSHTVLRDNQPSAMAKRAKRIVLQVRLVRKTAAKL